MIAMRTFIFTILVLSTSVVQAQTPLTKIGFGSCIRQDKDQPIWRAVNRAKPEIFVFLGDNIYGDSEDMSVLEAKYEKLNSNEGFATLRKNSNILATWDDHDYGVNDGGLEYPKRAESQAVFNDFWKVSKDSPRRKREGVYDSVIIGEKPHRVQFILLDTRYFRTRLKGRPGGKTDRLGPYIADESDDSNMLGDAQWKWLGEQLAKEAEVRIVATSIQAVAAEHGWETWGTFPKQRQKLFDLIAEKKAAGVIFISGDRHLAEISKETEEVAYPLFDLTSSSLNQPSGSTINKTEPNKRRLGENYLEVNYGTITIHWDEDPSLAFAIHDLHGNAVRAHSVRLSELQPK